MIAALPLNEIERLRALEATGLVDTAPEEDFDSLARLAAVICHTPIALITLLDSHRQWFKAKIGLDAAETERDVAFCAHAILGSDLFIVPDALEDPRFADNPLVTGDPNIRFYAGMPLKTSDGCHLGSLCVIDRIPRRLTEAQMESLRLLTRQAEKLISLRHLQRHQEQALAEGGLIERELRASRDLFHAFMDNSPFPAFMKDADGRIVYYNAYCAHRFDVDREAWLGKSDAELWPPEVAANLRSNDLAVLREWKTIVVEEKADPCGDSPVWRSYKFPFRDTGGREYVAGFAFDISADKQAQAQIEACQRALEDANAKLRSLAVTDSLTGLSNRRAFDAALDREYSLNRRYSLPLSLMILDIDNFKAFNDNFGHEEGDRILRRVAAAMSGSFRGTDVVARYGGEEFAVLLPNTSKQSAAETAERVRIAINLADADADAECEPISIGVSIGVATLDSAQWTRSEFVRKADDALYKAKREGKNRVCLS